MNGKPEQTSESGNGYHDKPKLTIAQQIAHLEAKGVTFDRYSKERAAAYLSDECDFYELTSYRKLFAKRQGGKRNGEYANLDFAQLVIFAELDEMLREVLFVMTRHIEHSCKVDLKRNISERNDEDGYAIVADYMASLTPKSRSYREAELERNGRNKYTKAHAVLGFPRAGAVRHARRLHPILRRTVGRQGLRAIPLRPKEGKVGEELRSPRLVHHKHVR